MLSRRELLVAAPWAAAALYAAGRGNPVGCQGNAWNTDPNDFPGFIQLMEKIKSFGFDGIESNVRYIQKQADNAKQAREQLRKTGIHFLGSHMGMTPNFDQLAKLIDISGAVGAERVILSGQGLAKNGKVDPAELKAKIEYLNRAGERCRKNRMKLAYHNHQGEFLNSSAEMEDLLRGTDPALVSLQFDTGHAFLAGADVAAFFTKHHARIEGLHLRDLRARKQVPLGEGEFDQKPLAEAVRKTGWRGWLIVEEELRTRDFALADRTVQSDRRFIRNVFGS
ncbi:MAG: sugar phosphate isomerase/epimerase [Acidobacteria bacterium]|nr:sugar phosphate isomerase/epimerase [Acidobacteriota bacterium]